MSLQIKQSRELPELEEFHHMIRENLRLLRNNCVQIQEVQKVLVKTIKFKFNLDGKYEHEQQPLPKDTTAIAKNIKHLEERIVALSHDIQYGFGSLHELEDESDRILNSLQTTHNTDEDEQQ